MNAITVRDKTTGKIVCMGPANGMYDPGYNPATQTKQEEPGYETLIAQHLVEFEALPKPKTLEERVAALEAKTP